MHLTSETLLEGGVLERDLTLGDIPGVLWTSATGARRPGCRCCSWATRAG